MGLSCLSYHAGLLEAKGEFKEGENGQVSQWHMEKGYLSVAAASSLESGQWVGNHVTKLAEKQMGGRERKTGPVDPKPGSATGAGLVYLGSL